MRSFNTEITEQKLELTITRETSESLEYQYREKPLRYEFYMPVKIKIKIFWEMTPLLRT